jgi:type IV secretion system protein VirD4
MYQLARLLSVFAVVLGIYSVAVATALFWPGSAVVLGVGAVAYVRWRRRGPLTTLGSARLADAEGLARAGMLGAERGAIIGRLPKSLAGRRLPNLRKLFDRNVSAKEACRGFWWRLHRSNDEFVRLPNAIHTSVFAPPGAGKNVSYVAPLALSCKESMGIVDPKAETALLTAEHRRKVFGHRVVLLDPYKLVRQTPEQTPDTFNPLDFIDKNDPQCLDRCRDLANALIVRQAEEREPHWNDSAEMWLTALIATVVQYG